MDNQKATESLKLALKILKGLDIRHWVDAGTCLGMVRDKDFIEHDHDIDIGIFSEDCADIDLLLALFGSFIINGFRLYHTMGVLNKGYEIALYKDGIKIDIFWYYLKGDKRWHAAWLNGGRNGDSDMIKLVFDKDLFEGVINIEEIKGIQIPMPTKTNEYLTARYGDNWMIPNKRWDWSKDPLCINNSFKI